MHHPFLTFGLILSCWCISVLAAASPWDRDKLNGVLSTAHQALSEGEPRPTVISNLTAAIEAEPNSRLVPFVKTLIADLKATDERTKTLSFASDEIRRHPSKYLSETRLSPLYMSVRRTPLAVDQLAQSSPDDPAVLLFRQGRVSIPLLIDLLNDNSIARTGRSISINGSTPRFLRVHEVAMYLIEQLSGCDFLLRTRSTPDHARITPHLREWWNRYKDRAKEEGIRDELDSAYRAARTFDQRHEGLIWMAGNLFESPLPPHSAYGEQILEDMVQSRRSMEAAATLARSGSRKPMEILWKRFDTARGNPSHVFTRSELSFLMEYGALEQWQMIYDLAQSEIQWYGQLPDISDGPNRAGVLPVLVENSDRQPLWIVPCVALALDQIKLFLTDRFYASEAVEALQNLTGEKVKSWRKLVTLPKTV